MKRRLFLLKLSVVALALIFGNVAYSQMGASTPGGGNAILAKLFGETKAFSAKCDVQILRPGQQEPLSVTTDFALLDGKMRTEMDMSKLASAQMPPNAVASMKQMGMDQVVTVVRPDTKALLLVYPKIKSCVNLPLPDADVEALAKKTKIEKTKLAEEKIDGHPCIKNKTIVTEENGRTSEFTLWNATDMKDFPIQIKTTDRGSQVTMQYKDIQFAKPDAKLFNAPDGYKQYKDMQTFIQTVMAKMYGGTVPK